MGCEIGTIKGRFKSKKQAECFIECFNTIMEEKEEWFEEGHRISMDDFESSFDCELDIWGRFEDTHKTWLQYVAAALIKCIPEEDFKITYNRAWDNCGETYYEEYNYESGRLTVKSMEEDSPSSFDDFDDFEDEEDDDNDFEEESELEVLFDEEWAFEYAGGEFKLISGALATEGFGMPAVMCRMLVEALGISE